MQPENLNLDSYEMFKEADGYINITMLDEQVMRSLLEKSMDLTGHSLYATNRTKGDGKVTLTFVTKARAAELKEQHLHSCRNSLGGIIPESLKQVIGKMAELNQGTVATETFFKTIVVPFEEKPQ